MHQATLTLATAIAAALVVTNAQPMRAEDPEPSFYGPLSGFALKDTRNLDSLGGGNLLRDLESALRTRALYTRQLRNLDSLSGVTFGGNKRFDTLSGQGLGAQKRTFDEIDRSGFNSFIKKKNFDEIDRSGFDGFVKRNFDEIDRSGFNSFVKRSAPQEGK